MRLHAVVVGAGPAGLAAALTFGRMRRRVLVLDSGEPRNRYTDHLHNFPTQDGVSPQEFRRRARADVEAYPTIEVRDGRAVEAHAHGDRVELALEDGEQVDTQRLVLAGGIKDTLPAVEGLAELFGTSVFTCPFCDGYEAAGSAIGMMCTAAGQLAHAAGLMRTLTEDGTVFANGVAVSEEELATAERHAVRVIAEPVSRLEAENGLLAGVVLSGGAEERCDRLFVPMTVRPSNGLAEELGCAMTEAGFVEVDALGRTSVPRVYAAGDAASPVHQVILAAASGTRSALAVIHDAIGAFELA